MRITVIGGGHGSYAAAADFALAGHEVTLWRRNGAALAPLLDDLRIHVTDAAGEHAAILAAVSDDLAHAVAGAALIVAPIPAFGHEELATTLAPHLHDGQVVLLPPGAFGTYLLARAAKGKPGVAYAETGTLPYLARKTSETAVRITERTVRLPTGVFPARLTEMAAPVLREVYPRTEIVVDAMDGALLNAGPIVHSPLMVMNAAALEFSSTFDIHNEGTQPVVRRATDALDAERIAIREELGYGQPHFPLADYYRTDGEEHMYGRAAKDRLIGSGDWREPIDLYSHRYVHEDIAIGLAFLISMGRYAGVATPVADGLMAIASAMLGEDLTARGGRTLTALGLDTLSRAELADLLENGFA